MKSISASIVVLAGAIVLVFGSHVEHDDTQLFLQSAGIALGLIGLVAWLKTIKQEQD